MFWGMEMERKSVTTAQMDEVAFHVADQYTGLHQRAAHIMDIKFIQESYMKLLVRGTNNLPQHMTLR